MSQTGPPADAKQAQAAALAELEAATKRKRTSDMNVAKTEAAIYAYEGSYLAETAASGGNIIRASGFDNYLKPPTAALNKKRMDQVLEADRLFSNSSSTFKESLAAQQQLEAQMAASRQDQILATSRGMVLQYGQSTVQVPRLPMAYVPDGLLQADQAKASSSDAVAPEQRPLSAIPAYIATTPASLSAVPLGLAPSPIITSPMPLGAEDDGGMMQFVADTPVSAGETASAGARKSSGNGRSSSATGRKRATKA